MDARIEVLGGDPVEETGQLWEWLRGERALAGRVESVRRRPGESELGAVDVLVVTLGSGGAGAVLARSLLVWLRTRRAQVSVTVRTKSGSVTVKASSLNDKQVLPLLEQVLRDRDDQSA